MENSQQSQQSRQSQQSQYNQASQHSGTMPSSQSLSPLSSRHPSTAAALRLSFSHHGHDERSPLLATPRSRVRMPQFDDGLDAASPRLAPLHPSMSYAGSFRSVQSQSQRLSRQRQSWSQRISQALTEHQDEPTVADSKGVFFADDRVWYDQFTSTDWVHDSIADAYRLKALRARRDFWGRAAASFDSCQGWILSAVCGIVIALIAYAVDVSETVVFGFKDGYCSRGWYLGPEDCCEIDPCPDWHPWSKVLGLHRLSDNWIGADWAEFAVYVVLVVLLATLACGLTLLTKTVVPSAYRMATFDENLAADVTTDPHHGHDDGDSDIGDDGIGGDHDGSSRDDGGAVSSDAASDPSPPPGLRHRSVHQTSRYSNTAGPPTGAPMVYYSAGGSGVAEVRVILSGFVLHGFLGLKTLLVKTVALVLSVSSGLSLGKEGPYVHIAACVGNIACRLFSKYEANDAKRREVLSAAAAAGVTVAFGAPLGGVLFGLEEVSYFFPAKTLFRTFFCCIVAALSLKFLNPYGTHKIVMFQVRYQVDWEFFELGSFIVVGMLGGAAGALFIKASRRWATSFRRTQPIRALPMLEVVLVALVTGLLSYWNPLAKLPVAKLLFRLASPCEPIPIPGPATPLSASDDHLLAPILQPPAEDDFGLCPTDLDRIPAVLLTLLTAFLIKGFLTVITFGIKVPAGIYVPSMVVGGLMGRMIGHMVQWVVLRFPDCTVWSACAAASAGSCIQPGVYGLIAAGSTMCGVTRLSVTLAVILFELTGSLDYVLPFSLAIMVAKWTADWLEPHSIYDLLTNMNAYPFLDNKRKPVFTSDLAVLVPRLRPERLIDVSLSPLVPAAALRAQLELLHRAGELDGGLPVVRNHVLVGLIPAPDLEYALDRLPDEPTNLCLMASLPSIEDLDDGASPDPCDFTRFIDPAPVALDIRSPMDLVYECFVKLGLRYICVLRDGRYAGMTHKKTFVKYMRELEELEAAR